MQKTDTAWNMYIVFFFFVFFYKFTTDRMKMIQHDVIMLHLLPFHNDKHVTSDALIISQELNVVITVTAQRYWLRMTSHLSGIVGWSQNPFHKFYILYHKKMLKCVWAVFENPDVHV